MSENQINLSDNERSSVHSLKMDDLGSSKKSYTSRLNWRIIAAISSVLALLLAIGLSVALGLFLRKTECGPPPRHSHATIDYMGSATSGSLVTYVCPRPLVFPNNEVTFPLQCKDNLKWNVTDIPSCARDGEKHCNGLINKDGFNLSLSLRDDVTILMAELTLQGQVPKSFFMDVDSKDESKCSYGGEMLKKDSTNLNILYFSPRSPLLAMKSAFGDNRSLKNGNESHMYSVMVEDRMVDPGTPYEILIRGSGNLVAITLKQGKYLNITFHEIDIIMPEITSTTAHSITNPITTTKVNPTTASVTTARSATPVSSTEPVPRTTTPVSSTEPVPRTTTPVSSTEPVQRTTTPVSSTEPVQRTTTPVSSTEPVQRTTTRTSHSTLLSTESSTSDISTFTAVISSETSEDASFNESIATSNTFFI